MLLFIIFLIKLISADEQFAGNGLKTFGYQIDNKILEVDCMTYDDCNELLCSYIYQLVYMVVVKPNQWKGDCSQLNTNDTRQLESYIDIFNGSTYYGTFNPGTISDTSIALCRLGQNKSITLIQYFIYNCSF